MRLFCFPYAGGSAATYARWPRAFEGSSVELRPFELPGRGARRTEPLVSDLFSLVVQTAEELRPQLTSPFAFYGHSFGALLGFEVARFLRREWGLELEALVVGACEAPRKSWRFPPVDELTDEELMHEVSRRYGGVPDDVLTEPDLWHLMIPPLRADLSAGQRYAYPVDRPLTCPILTVLGTSDPAVTAEDMAPWSDETTGPVDRFSLEGGHFFVHDAWERAAGLVRAALMRRSGPIVP